MGKCNRALLTRFPQNRKTQRVARCKEKVQRATTLILFNAKPYRDEFDTTSDARGSARAWRNARGELQQNKENKIKIFKTKSRRDSTRITDWEGEYLFSFFRSSHIFWSDYWASDCSCIWRIKELESAVSRLHCQIDNLILMEEKLAKLKESIRQWKLKWHKQKARGELISYLLYVLQLYTYILDFKVETQSMS